MSQLIIPEPPAPMEAYIPSLLTSPRSTLVTDQAMGARCAVAADIDGDGLLDLVSASSNDNAVSWFRNEGVSEEDYAAGITMPTFSIKKQITWSSLGSRIVTVADVDADGDMDVVGASYYDSSLRWFENDGTGSFEPHLISSAVDEGQGVFAADINNDGTVDLVSASSGDNTIAVFTNLGNGTFCEIKTVVDDNAIGARTAIAVDLNGDGWLDIASASKDDDTVAWYPNDGEGKFTQKLIVSQGEYSAGAYSLVAQDVDGDGHQDLVVASNGNDAVTLWRNDGLGNFTRTLIYDQADFVLSVTAVDFDRDGDIDVASASFFDGRVIWYENLDGKGNNWANHTIYTGLAGHYVSNADMDGDGDVDLIAVDHSENSVTVYYARTGCDESNETSFDNINDGMAHRWECCRIGTEWNQLTKSCDPCSTGEYGSSDDTNATCIACPKSNCNIVGLVVLPVTCASTMLMEGAFCEPNIESNVATCTCPVDTVRDPTTAVCEACPEGQVRPDDPDYPVRGLDTFGNYSVWEQQQGTCEVYQETNNNGVLIGVITAVCALLLVVVLVLVWIIQSRKRKSTEEDLWRVVPTELKFSEPPQILGRGSFGLVLLAEYRGTNVAVKRVIPPREPGSMTDSVVAKRPSIMFHRRSSSGQSLKSENGNSNDTERRRSSVLSVLDEKTPSEKEYVDLEVPTAETGNKTVLLNTGSGNHTFKRGLDSFFHAFYSTGTNKACDVTTHEKLVKDFIKEMRHLSKLRHPCITTVMGAVFESTNQEPALVMEHMERGSLYDILHNTTVALDGDVLLPILQDICQGLRFLHCADPPIVHGDMKSANILVDDKFRAKIADFGLTQKKKIGVAGTPYWMSPELLRGESENTTCSDIYSVGIILYEVYSRKDPYEGVEDNDFRTILTKVCDKSINLRPPVPESCPDTIGVLMRECLDADPSARPTSEELDLRLRRERAANVEPGEMHLTVQKKGHKISKSGNELIYEMFPKHVAEALQEGRKIEAEHHECVTVFFSDVVNFTNISQQLGHVKCAKMLDTLYTKFDALSEQHGVFKIEVIGDAYLAVTNLVQDQGNDHAKRLAEFAIDAVKAASEVPLDEDDAAKGFVEIRVGLNSGPVIADVLGTRLPKYSIFGDTVNTASRMESNSLPRRIHCSITTANLLEKQAPHIPLVSRGHIEIKGKGEMHTCWVNETAAPQDSNGNDGYAY